MKTFLLLLILVGGGYFAYYQYNHNKAADLRISSLEDKVDQQDALIAIAMKRQTTTPADTGSVTETPAQSSVDSYKITKPYLYVYGKNLASIKILGVPTGTGVTTETTLGTAILQTTGTDGEQAWAFKPSQSQLALTSMSFEAYDASGKMVSKTLLSPTGSTSIYSMFY